MMMNQGGGGSSDATISQLDPNLREVSSGNHGYPSAYSYPNVAHAPLPSTSVSQDTPWAMHRTDNSSAGNNSNNVNSSYHPDQYTGSLPREVQNGVPASSHATTSSSSVAASGLQDYSAYTPYSSTTTPYGYGNTGYQDSYYGYQQQQNNNSYPQQVGGHQISGAPYQSLTSFPNSGSYAGPASYPSTYYNTGDYQTTGGYSSSSYSSQPNSWNDGNYASYPPQQYPSYAPAESNGVPSSSNEAVAQVSYEQQWADYYSQTATDVTCAPGTENKPATGTSTSDFQIPGVSGGYPIASSQPPPPGTTSWRPEPASSSVPTLQVGHVTGDAHDAYWRYGPTEYQNPQTSQNSLPYSNPSNSNPVPYESSQSLQQTAFSQGSNRQLPSTQYVPHSYQSPVQTIPSSDTRRVNTLQIPTNPRIASNLSSSLPKPDKDTSTTNAAAKPAYISVAVPQYTSEVSPHVAAESFPKSGECHPSLAPYVARCLARCKDEPLRNASLSIVSEIVRKATSDGTIYTRNWDMEPLFPLPDMNSMNKELQMQSSPVVFTLPKYKRSPSRRTKSRWEPISEEKLVENLASVNHVPVKVNSWEHPKETEKMVSSGKWENKGASWDITKKKEVGWSSAKFPQSRQQAPNKSAQKMPKKPRLGDGPRAADNGDASSDSDKEHGLTAYYAGAIALANSPEEKKKRENRFKRFDRGHRAETKHSRLKVVGTGNLYTKKASALELSRSNDDVASRAVEDIDWDSLTVKGTCQEIEKRYLRLTSAPDPTTVRPEEVLEKALLMVQNTQKNYLYKCDQLKSIRQDLTVQRIHNELTVKVYETHARLALEAGDLPEFNQCQSQLKNLYAEGINGCHMEFSAYNLLCVILHSSNNRDLVSSMARLSIQAKKDEAIKHALAVRSAVTSGNYVLFFRLYKTAPNLSTCLMDLHAEKMRFEAVKCMSRSYRPTVPLSSIAHVLGFTSLSTAAEGNEEKDSDGLEECEEWLKAHGACLIVDNTGEMQLDAKASSSSLFMPEPEDAVAHGDTTLAVNDFLTRTS